MPEEDPRKQRALKIHKKLSQELKREEQEYRRTNPFQEQLGYNNNFGRTRSRFQGRKFK